MIEPNDIPVVEWQRGVRLAIDVGDARIGVARCDVDGILAVPVETVQRRRSPEEGLRRLAELVNDLGALRVYVGYPLGMDGKVGKAAQRIRSYVERLVRLIGDVEVYLVDERLTTVSAHAALTAAGKKMKDHRKVVDQAAAVAILESAIAREKATGEPAGQLVRV